MPQDSYEATAFDPTPSAMSSDDLASLSRRDKLRGILLVVALIAATLWITTRFLQPAPSRHIVLASGAGFGLYHQYAERYKQILARDGVSSRNG